MRIDNQRTPENTPAARLDAVTGKAPGIASAPPSAPADTAQISGDVALATRAMTAAQSASDVRPDVVARATALLQNGQVGQDLDHLANTMIDSLLS